jgi:serine/threonine protein kinase
VAPPNEAALQAAVTHALARGYLTPTQLDEARAAQEKTAQAGHQASLLTFVGRMVLPAQLEELRGVYQRSLEGGVSEKRKQVGPYLVVKELARGGMGVVSLAQHAQLDRPVALKQMLGADAAPGSKAQERFRREAAALAQLRHPNIVGVHGYGVHGGTPYIALELVEGEALGGRLDREGPLDVREAAELTETLARALHHAHQRGILHRDMKPDNVLVEAGTGRLLIADFGVATDPSDERERLTRTGEMLGTPGYMPPEQASGEKDRVDARADVYSLGATLFALLCGRAPFEGATPINVIMSVMGESPPRPSSLRPEVEPDLEAIVLATLEKDPEDRYDSAAALADDLRRYLDGYPIAATPPTTAARLRKWRQRNKALAPRARAASGSSSRRGS